jgi:hypothetical protein
LEGDSPSEGKSVSERNVSESVEEDSKLADLEEDRQGKKQSAAMFVVEEDEVTMLPSTNAFDAIPKNTSEQQMRSKGGEQGTPVAGEGGRKVMISCITYIFMRVMLNSVVVQKC